MTTRTKMKPGEVAKTIGVRMYRDAYDRGVNLSMWLETQVEVDSADRQRGATALGVVMQALGIRTVSIPEAGMWATTYENATNTPHKRAATMEWMTQQYRNAAHGKRATFTSQDALIGSQERPWMGRDGAQLIKRLQASIPFMSLIAGTVNTRDSLFSAIFLEQNKDLRKVRIGEGSDIPTIKLRPTGRAAKLHKFGRAIEMTYEQIRRLPLDMVGLLMQIMAVNDEVDKVALLIDTAVNGDNSVDTITLDGVNTAAAVTPLTALDASTSPGSLTLRAWLAWLMQFSNPYMLDVTLGQSAALLDLLLLTAGTQNIPMVNFGNASGGIGGFTPINQGFGGATRVGWTDDAPANRLVSFDSRTAFLYMTEIASEISEVERVIRNQTEIMTMTETCGVSVFDPAAIKIMRLDA